jgi:putative flippase GtrA
MSSLAAEATRLAKYGAVGVLSNVTLYLLYLAFLWVGLAPQGAVGICYVLGVALSYVLNRSWTFKSTASHGRDVPRFLAAYAIGFVFTIGAITVLIRWMPPEVAQLVNIGLTAGVIYLCLRVMRFGQGDVSATGKSVRADP